MLLRFILFVGLGLTCYLQLKAQDATPYLYSMHVKQSFSSWGDCSSDPYYEYAYIYLYFGYIIDTKYITDVNPAQIYEFEKEFINEDPEKDLSNLKYGFTNLTKIGVHAHASDIKNDKDLYYDIDLEELVIGKYSESHEASDPCNNVISWNREGYTMTTTVYIDDPVFVNVVGDDDNCYKLDYERVSLKVGDYYENDEGSPLLQVKPVSSGDDGWETLTSVIVAPYNTINLSYEQIAGTKGGTNSHYFEWMGKPLHFRIIKTLMNDELTMGNITDEVRFYPDGLQYNILQTTRTSCSNGVNVYVQLADNNDFDYFHLDRNRFMWRARENSGSGYYNCEMLKPTVGDDFYDDETVYKIHFFDDGTGDEIDDPFNEPDPVTYLLQLEVVDEEYQPADAYACEREFTIPAKPDDITTNQKDPQYRVKGVLYNLPSKYNPYALLDIVDDYEYSALRRPYTITGPGGYSVKVDTVSTKYDDLSPTRKAELDAEFNAHFAAVTATFDTDGNPYRNYFMAKYNLWFNDQNPTSPSYRVAHPDGVHEFYIYKYHSHYHTHTCTHSHTHKHYCECIDKASPVNTIEDVKKIPDCNMSCTGHGLSNPNPHNLCDDNHSHTVVSNPDYIKTETHSHQHSASHTHIHSHTGIHAHGENANYDYYLVRKTEILDAKASVDTKADFSDTYNNVSYISVNSDGLNASYIFRRNGNDIIIDLWTADEVKNTIYPDQGIATTWKDEFKAIYKEQWLEEKLGVKIPIDTSWVNPTNDIILTLTDKDDCDHPTFTINVTAPPTASFSVSDETPPSTACSENGSAIITYDGGGDPPYVYGTEELINQGDEITVSNLGYGNNPVTFSDEDGFESATVPVNIPGSVGITSTSVKHVTCSPENGSITVNVSNVSGTKTYTLTNRYTDDEYIQTKTGNSCTFPNLPAGFYEAEVDNSTCPTYSEPNIEIKDSTFDVSIDDTDNATFIGGNGGVTISLENNTNGVTWGLDVATIFGYTDPGEGVDETGMNPAIYNYSATHTDNYGYDCVITDQFEIEGPWFTANVNIVETDDNASISISLTDGALLSPYHFELLNSAGEVVGSPGETGRAFSTTVQNSDNYTLSLVYGSNNDIDVYYYDYPSPAINDAPDVTEPLCPGGDGSITLNPSGGLETTDSISTNGVDYTINTTHTVQGGEFLYKIKEEEVSYEDVSGNTVTINHKLINSFSVNIPEPDPVSAKVLSYDVTCNGAGDGRVILQNLSEGSGTYQYRVDNGSWKSPQTETTSLSPGYHNITLKDSGNGCDEVALTEFFIDEPEALSLDSLRVVQPTCELDNGEIYIEAEGGNGLYKFDWTYNSNSFHSIALSEDSITHLGDSLQYGNYNLTVTDNNDCIFTQNIELNEYFNPVITNTSVTDARCYGESNGEIVVTEVTGTNPLHKITLNGLDFELKDTIDNIANPFESLPKGRYELFAIDDSSCVSDAPYQIAINQPDTILYTVIDTIVPVLQKGRATGQIHATIYGGNSGFKTLSLLNSDNLIIDQKQERNQFSTYFDSLYAGKYNIEVIDEKGCTYASPELTIIEPLTTLGFNITEKNDAKCKAQTGSFTVEGFGGFGQYQFKRVTDNGYYDFNTFSNLYAGNYIVTVRDRLGATFTDTIVIYEPKDSLQANLIDFSNPTCGNNGSISVNLNGGVAPYNVFFDNSPDTSEIPTPQNYTITNRPSGGYLLHIQDANGCKFELETNLSDQELIEILGFDLTYPSTSGASDGEIIANVKGGKSPLSYSWKEQFGSNLAETSKVLSNVSSGHYELTVQEDDGCSAIKSTYLADISDLSLDILEITHETSFQAENGYAHLYSSLESLENIEIIDPNGMQTILPITDSTALFYEDNSNIYLRNLKGGSYFVMATNASNEKIYTEFEIKTYESFDFENIEITHAKEIGDSSGTIYVVVEGGAGNNTFNWEYLDGTVNHLDSINSEYTSILQNIASGNYSVTVTDQYNNSISRSFVVEQPEAPLDISITDYRNESCKDYEDAYVVLKASGGWGDYQYKQDQVEYFTNDTAWLNLSVREHYFYLTDKMGTVDSIAINITEPDYLKASVEFIDSVNCKNASDGNIFLNISGGTEPYRFADISSPLFWTQDTIIKNLAEGDYSFIFTDNHNCVGQDTVHTYMPEPDSLLFNAIDVTHTTCNTDNGTISVDMQGGTRPYSYEWTDFDGNVIGNQNAVSELNQNALYFLEVQDAHNCLQQYQQLIKPSTNPVVVDIDTVPVLCYGGSTGKANIVDVTPANPYAPYSFTWSNNNTGEYSEGYPAGLHSVTITDTNDCSTVKYFEVTQPDTLQLEVVDFKDAHCFGYNDGFIEIQNSGGVGNYDIEWSNGETTEKIDSLYKGVYSVTITDSNLCFIVRTFEIMEPDQVVVDLGDDLKICPGNTITIDGQEFEAHEWSTSDGVISNERFITVDEEGSYFLEVTNDIGCFAHDDIEVSIGNDALNADFLMSSESYLGDTLFIYELSNLELDSLYWDYEQEIFSNITTNSIPHYMLHLVSNQTGIYNVGLWAYSGGCMSSAIKQVEIIENNDTTDSDDFMGYTDPLILALNVYPNPTNGNFSLSIELRETVDIKVSLYSINLGMVVDLREEYGNDYYDINYQLNNLNTGVYVIMVTANNERKQLKIIVE